MKSYKNEMRAFSLAEALITLLIVCLITLASIPVITKKKRDQNNYATGTWMCTKNTEGKYVVYNSVSPKGDVNNPDTWNLSQEGEGCTFYPPLNTRNFAITVIGGGGKGADGQADEEVYMPNDYKRYSVTKETEGVFHLAVIGTGGAGMGSDDKTQGHGVGGQGGGGAYWIGQLNFVEGDSLVYKIGDSLSGGKDDDGTGHANNRDHSDYETYIMIGNDKLISAGNGQGGEVTATTHNFMTANTLKRGTGGSGGTLSLNSDMLKNRVIAGTVTSGNGEKGRDNKGCRHNDLEGCTDSQKDPSRLVTKSETNICYGIQNGVQTGSEYDKNFYGTGGFGCKYNNGLSSEKGIVRLWQIIEQPGLGGKAAKPESYNIPHIKGKAEVKIGAGGGQYAFDDAVQNNGQETTVTIYNIQGGIDRVLKGFGGEAGESGDKVSIDYAPGTKGQNSLWNNKGGGTVGACQQGTYSSLGNTSDSEPEYVQETDSEGNPICEVGIYYLGAVNLTPESGKMETCPLNGTTSPTKGLCVGCDATDAANCRFEKTSIVVEDVTEWILTPIDTRARAYAYLLNNLTEGKNYNDYSNYFLEEKISSWNKEASANLTGYTYTPDSADEPGYECLKYKMVIRPNNKSNSSVSGEFYCDNSGDGEMFGAGGGGGSATNKVGAKGNGGNGAPGAVIIEW